MRERSKRRKKNNRKT